MAVSVTYSPGITMSSRGRLPSLRTAVATALLVAGVAFAPGRAAAECGDYVRVDGRPMAGHDPGAPGHADPGWPTPAKPCHGPNCSGNPSTPAPPLTAPVADPSGLKAWAARFVADLGADAGGRSLPPLTSDSGAVSRPGSVFHPPRGR